MNEDKLEVRIQIYITQLKGMHGQIELSQSFTIRNRNFLEICEILGQFEKLADKIKKEEN